MKKIEAIIKTVQAERSQNGPERNRHPGHDRLRSEGFRAPERPHGNLSRSEYTVDFLPKIKIETVLPDTLVKQAVQAIITAAKTGKIGDGKVFVSTIDDAYRIRTEEQGDTAV